MQGDILSIPEVSSTQVLSRKRHPATTPMYQPLMRGLTRLVAHVMGMEPGRRTRDERVVWMIDQATSLPDDDASTRACGSASRWCKAASRCSSTGSPTSAR